MDKRDGLIGGLLAAGLLAWLVPFAPLGIDPHHDGIMLKPALDVLSGQTLFRDTFMQYGALTCYLQVAALWIHPTLLCLRLMTAAIYAASFFLFYASWRLILPRGLTIVAAGLFFLLLPAYEKKWIGDYWVLMPWSSAVAMFFQAIALHALLRVIRDEQATRWGFLLGFACAATLWCRQPVGVMLTGTVVVVGFMLHWTGWQPVHHSKRNIALWTAIGFLVVTGALLGNICLSGAFDAWWYQNFVWPRKWATDTGDEWWRLFSKFLYPGNAVMIFAAGLALCLPAVVQRWYKALPARGVLAYYAILLALGLWQHERLLTAFSFRDGGWTMLLPAIVVIQAVASVIQGLAARTATRPAEFYAVAAAAAVSLASLTQYYPVPDPWHVFWSLAPAFGLVVYACWRWTCQPSSRVVLALALALAPSVWLKAQQTRGMLALPHVTLQSPAVLRGMQVSEIEADVFHRIMQVIDPVERLRPDIAAVMNGRDALYLCFINNRTNATPYFVTWPGLNDQADDRRRVSFVAQRRPLLFMHRADWVAVNDFYRRSRYVPLLYVPETTLEIAVPQELADALGLGVYGARLPAAPVPGTPKP